MRRPYRAALRRVAPALAAVTAVALVAVTACTSSPDDVRPASAGTAPARPASNALGGSIVGPPDGSTPVDGGHLVFGLEAEPEGLDPSRYALAGSGHLVASALMDTLMKLDDNGAAVPHLATAMEPSEDFTTWTITLPSGVTFSDGTPLTADVVAWNFSLYRESIFTGKAWRGVVAVTVPDPTHVVVRWAFPFVSFDTRLTTQDGYVFAPGTREREVDDPIGTGPFIRVAHELGTSWELRRNPNYWRKGLPHLDSLELRPIPDDARRLALLESGDLDVMVTLRPDQILQIRADARLKRVENAGGEEEHLALNTSKAPFDDLLAREAVAYATDGDRWRRDVMKDVLGPANGPFAPGQLGYLEDNGYPTFDLARAKALVAAYREKTGQPLRFELLGQADVGNVGDSQALADMYTAAGMEVTVRSLPQINLLAAAAAGGYDMVRFRLYSAHNPDTDAVPFWRSWSIGVVSINFPRFDSRVVDRAIADALATTDPAGKQTAYETVNREFATQLPNLWLGRTVWVMAAQPQVNGIYAAVNGTVQTIGVKPWLAELWLDG